MKTITRIPWAYLLLAYGWAWAWCIPVILTRKDYQESPVLFVTVFMAIFGPGLAGILMTYREGNREARREFWRRLVDLAGGGRKLYIEMTKEKKLSEDDVVALMAKEARRSVYAAAILDGWRRRRRQLRRVSRR